MARITGKEAEGLMAAYARVHAPEIKEDVSEKDVSTEETLSEETLSEEELQELLGALKRVGSAAGSAIRSGAQSVGNAARSAGTAVKKGIEGGIDRVKTAVGTKVQQGRDLATGGTEKLKQGNQLKDRMAQKRETLKTQQASGGQSGTANDPGKTQAQILALKNKRRQMNDPKGYAAQQNMSGADRAKAMARARLAAGKSTVTGESYDQYDQIVDFLVSEGYVDNEVDAKFVMSQPEFIDGFNGGLINE